MRRARYREGSSVGVWPRSRPSPRSRGLLTRPGQAILLVHLGGIDEVLFVSGQIRQCRDVRLSIDRRLSLRAFGKQRLVVEVVVQRVKRRATIHKNLDQVEART